MTLLTSGGQKLNEALVTEGLYMVVQDQKFSMSYSEGIRLGAGKDWYLALDKRHIIQQEKPYSTCRANLDTNYSFNRSLYEFMMKKLKRYTSNDCSLILFQIDMSTKCNCSDMSFESVFPDVKPCLSTKEIGCGLEHYSVFFSLNETLKKILEYCPAECERVDFSLTISSGDISPGFINKAKKRLFNKSNITTEQLADNLISVKIFYPKLEFEEIVESVKVSEIQLVSDIGGILGLFVGFSFLICLELFDVLVEIGLLFYEQKSKNKKSSKKLDENQ